eukprot:TRINITY_DN36892_c0_g1_i1.p1 TRINITY_DN36892_c0_g1~~TRINITY_DN36892_c0_g1_i1.p1  ORF type:complete len:471 (-),score=143.07 TRINITY_DN36892_c0_g1_i1:38-1345(-)
MLPAAGEKLLEEWSVSGSPAHQQEGLVVKNTFIDVCQEARDDAETRADASESRGGGSAQLRTESDPGAPAGRRRAWDDEQNPSEAAGELQAAEDEVRALQEKIALAEAKKREFRGRRAELLSESTAFENEWMESDLQQLLGERHELLEKLEAVSMDLNEARDSCNEAGMRMANEGVGIQREIEIRQIEFVQLRDACAALWPEVASAELACSNEKEELRKLNDKKSLIATAAATVLTDGTKQDAFEDDPLVQAAKHEHEQALQDLSEVRAKAAQAAAAQSQASETLAGTTLAVGVQRRRLQAEVDEFKLSLMAKSEPAIISEMQMIGRKIERAAVKRDDAQKRGLRWKTMAEASQSRLAALKTKLLKSQTNAEAAQARAAQDAASIDALSEQLEDAKAAVSAARYEAHKTRAIRQTAYAFAMLLFLLFCVGFLQMV